MAGWRDRLSTVAIAHPVDRGDLSAALIRPNGIFAWAAASGLSANTAALATALRTCLGEPHAHMADGQQGELGQLKAGKARDNAEGRSDCVRSTLAVGSAQICPDAAERPSHLRTGKTSEEQERRWHPIRQTPR
ncbi:aromatic-ring hydroxylase C-terminal domain-containing protein [Streptomyces decoyicus]